MRDIHVPPVCPRSSLSRMLRLALFEIDVSASGRAGSVMSFGESAAVCQRLAVVDEARLTRNDRTRRRGCCAWQAANGQLPAFGPALVTWCVLLLTERRTTELGDLR
jgi:hypothetical protein